MPGGTSNFLIGLFVALGVGLGLSLLVLRWRRRAAEGQRGRAGIKGSRRPLQRLSAAKGGEGGKAPGAALRMRENPLLGNGPRSAYKSTAQASQRR